MLIDSHAHLTDDRLAGEVGEVLERARGAGVSRVVTIGTTLDDSRAAVALSKLHPDVYASAGVHPHSAEEASPEALSEIEALAREPEVVALGETGLDYFYDNAPREAQRRSFLHHLEMGRRLDLPVVVHAREADDDVVALLREAGAGTRGVLHCFAGRRPMLEAALALGWYVSFSGMITFPKYGDAELLRAVPLDRLLVETDSPYLTPVPHRGKRNEPAHVALVSRRAAELREEDAELVATATARNAMDLYRIR
jgi:TatD DNase family protein